MTEVSEAAATTTRYWCHLCAQAVTPTMEAEIKCPHCDSGFVEEMQGRDFESTTSDLRSERTLSLWAPILLGMVDESGSGPARRLRRSFRREQPLDDLDDGDDDDDEDEEDDEIEHEIEDIFRRSRRRSAILQLLESLRDEDRERDRDRERDAESLILINSNNQAIILQGNFNSEESNGSESGSGLGDYFLGPGLDLLLQHLSENDPNRYGTPPAMKEAVEGLPSTRIEVASTCSVCLDDFEIGNEAKELPCKHQFHDGCILPWLELHSTCPVCRFQLPAEETKDNGENTGEGIRESGSVGIDESGNRHENRPWFSELFSSSDGTLPNTGADLSEEQDSREA